MSRVFLLLTLQLALASSVASQTSPMADPVRSFVGGFNPTDQDFFARSPQQTVLLRMRLDLDGDGRVDLALSESSVFGNGGGPWLLFRRLPRSGYRYLGEVFAAPGDLRIDRSGSGPVLSAGSALSAEITHVVRYRLNGDTIVKVAEHDTSGVRSAARGADVERCRLPDYQRDAVHCWHTGQPQH